jgi:hypothetical protein
VHEGGGRDVTAGVGHSNQQVALAWGAGAGRAEEHGEPTGSSLKLVSAWAAPPSSSAPLLLPPVEALAAPPQPLKWHSRLLEAVLACRR